MLRQIAPVQFLGLGKYKGQIIFFLKRQKTIDNNSLLLMGNEVY